MTNPLYFAELQAWSAQMARNLERSEILNYVSCERAFGADDALTQENLRNLSSSKNLIWC